MKFDINMILDNGCSVICGGTADERNTLAENILNQHPEYKIEVGKQFFPKKVGPFTLEVKQTVEDLLMKDPAVKARGRDYMMQQLKALGCENYLYRKPKTLSYLQRERISLIIDVINGKSSFLFHDGGAQNAEYCLMVITWLSSTAEFRTHNRKIIWLTELSGEDILHSLDEKGSGLFSSCAFFELKNGSLREQEDVRTVYELNQKSAVTKLSLQLDAAEKEKDYETVQNCCHAIIGHKYASDFRKDQACRTLAEMYEFGTGVPEDYKEAAKWYRKSVQFGNPDSDAELKSQLYLLDDYEQLFLEEYNSLSKYTENMSEETIERLVRQTIKAKLDEIEIQKLMKRGR